MNANLCPAAGASVLEIGCGTGPAQAARRCPQVRFFGTNVSTEMLGSAMGGETP